MSAGLDPTGERAAFGEALIKEAVDTLGSWLTKDNAVPTGSGAETIAEALALYYRMIIAARRRGLQGLSFLLQSAEEIGGLLGTGDQAGLAALGKRSEKLS